MLVPACTTDERARLRTIPWVTPGTGVRLTRCIILAFSFRHAESSLILNFTGAGLQEITDENWGLDNVAVFAVAVPPTLTYGEHNQYAAGGAAAAFTTRAAAAGD